MKLGYKIRLKGHPYLSGSHDCSCLQRVSWGRWRAGLGASQWSESQHLRAIGRSHGCLHLGAPRLRLLWSCRCSRYIWSSSFAQPHRLCWWRWSVVFRRRFQLSVVHLVRLWSSAFIAQPNLSVLRFTRRTMAERRPQVLNQLLIIY